MFLLTHNLLYPLYNTLSRQASRVSVWAWCLLAVLGGCAEGGRVLLLHPLHASSHIMALRRISEALAHRGHQVNTAVELLEYHCYRWILRIAYLGLGDPLWDL